MPRRSPRRRRTTIRPAAAPMYGRYLHVWRMCAMAGSAIDDAPGVAHLRPAGAAVPAGRRQVRHGGGSADVVADHHSLKAQLIAQQPGDDHGGEHRPLVVNLRVEGGGDHQKSAPAFTGVGVGLQIGVAGAAEVRVRCAVRGKVGIAAHPPQTGEMLRRNRDAGSTHAADDRQAVLAHALGIGAELAVPVAESGSCPRCRPARCQAPARGPGSRPLPAGRWPSYALPGTSGLGIGLPLHDRRAAYSGSPGRRTAGTSPAGPPLDCRR